ncbi:MAG TPA: hypothetical protein VFY85_07130 [Gemmatimonadaceae bacterium]|nr:hypothetical protein [Gemmatimonadaceae bacterium]
MTVHRAPCLLLVGAGLALTACARHADRGDSSRSVGSVIVPPRDTARLPATVQDTNVELQERLSRLEREARALARTDGCDSLAQCRTAPVGWRSCGGPRTYLVYCAATTDTVALFRKLAELEAAEKEYNLKSGLMSSCVMREPPQVGLRGRSCRE